MSAMPETSDYFSHSRQEMLAFVPFHVRHVLELGCASGVFGANIKQRQNAEVWGLELDPAAAKLASKHLDRVLQGTLEDHLGSLPSGHFDCIVCNDVLEHLPDPEAILRTLRRIMAPSAVLVGSIPNMRYFPVLFDLVWNADWHYGDYGVLDRTHQRFFTGKSLARTLRECGYQPQQIAGINPTPSLKARLASVLSLGKFSDCRYLQYAFVATASQA
jgi:2-polyprenyl-3-methyl-5-hydroxy-6-metoxy-1,4-benzoquinol methylase